MKDWIMYIGFRSSMTLLGWAIRLNTVFMDYRRKLPVRRKSNGI